MPEKGALREKNLEIRLSELELGPPFLGETLLADYELKRVADTVMANVTLSSRLRQTCSLCLEEFEEPVKAEFLVEFGPRPPEDANPRSDDADDPGPGYAWFAGEELPLGEEMRQEMELCVPFAPLCRKDCKGLCPQCGANRNQKDCGCAPATGDNPFARLKNLFDRPKEN